MVGHLRMQRAPTELPTHTHTHTHTHTPQSLLRKIFRLCVALDWLKIGLNNNILFYFVLFNCSWKKRQKTFPCLHKKKEKLFGVEKCVLKRFLKLLKLKCLNRKSPFFISTYLNSRNKKTFKVKSFSGFSKKSL